MVCKCICILSRRACALCEFGRTTAVKIWGRKDLGAWKILQMDGLRRTGREETFMLIRLKLDPHIPDTKSATQGEARPLINVSIIHCIIIIIVIIIIIYPSTKRVVGAPQIISQPVSSIFPCSPLPSGTWRTPGLSILLCCLPTFCLPCLLLVSLCLARWFWPDLMNRRHYHTTAVCVSLQ